MELFLRSLIQLTPPAGEWEVQLCSEEGTGGLCGPGEKKNKNHPLNNQMPLDWLQKALSGGVHSARWLPAEMRAAPKMTAILQKSSSWHGAGALAIRD